ncbi:hypothetical protein ACFQXB_11360 [Plastorhodobacter daqingensis]|uniref:Uncharacterized protein n=1 Tax=Plastorhodobacter daqingensis TaxID=1387281 RepID=A0ABW2UJ93_9RHOB
MHIDFCFIDSQERLIATGWSLESDPGLGLQIGAERLAPLVLERHARQDLRSSEPFGWIAVFALGEVAGAGEEPIFLESQGAVAEIAPDRLFEDEPRLVEIGVDEVFAAYVRLVAAGAIGVPGEDPARLVRLRLRARQVSALEADDFALSVDRCQVSPSGEGLIVGWFLGAGAGGAPLVALAMDARQVVPVTLAANSLRRDDLHAYAPRYRFTGTDGFCGAFRLPEPPEGPVRVILMPPGEEGMLLAAPAEPQPPARIARSFCEIAPGLADAAQRQALRRVLVPPTMPDLPAEPPPTDAPAGAGVLLILDHDLSDCDLRDVLRKLLADIDGPVQLHLLRPAMSPVLEQALRGADHEEGSGRLTLAAVSLTAMTPLSAARRVVFGRSSTLFQMDLAPLLAAAAPAAALVLDPIGTIDGAMSPAALLQRFERDVLPFAAAIDGALFASLLRRAPRGFLTLEAQLRLLLEGLAATGGLDLRRADMHRYFAGRAGPHAETFPGALDWHAWDAATRRLMAEASQ